MNRITTAFLCGVAAFAFAPVTHAADLIIEEPAAGVVDVSGDWDGAYVGVFAGGAWGTYEDNGPVGGDEDISGWLIGLAAGADFTVADGIVVGVVADAAWSDVGFGFTDIAEEYNFSIDWQASLRGKLGFDGGSFLPYLTAGLAVAGTSVDYVSLGPVFEDSQVHVGWTVGAGVEFALTDSVSVDLLYRYSDYGTQTYNDAGPDYEASFTTHTASVGLNWSF